MHEEIFTEVSTIRRSNMVDTFEEAVEWANNAVKIAEETGYTIDAYNIYRGYYGENYAVTVEGSYRVEQKAAKV